MRKRVLITGASGGIGKEIAKVFAKNNYDLVLVARNNEILEEIKNEVSSLYSVDVRIVCIDLEKSESPEMLYQSVGHMQIDVLINNAGLCNFGEFYNNSLAKEEKVIQVNILALVKLTHLFMQSMIERNDGIIINIGSTAAFQPGPLMANYYASKAYVLSFTEAIAEELHKTKVKAIAYCPSPVKTNFLTKANVEESKVFASKYLSQPKDIAKDIYDCLSSNKVVKISSKRFSLMIFAERFAPRNLISKIVYMMQNQRK